MRLYLLGRASAEDSSWLEEELFTDGALYQELLIVEDDLIDQYLRDNLPANDRQSFETYFLQAPERQQKLRFGRALHKYVDLAGTSEPLEDLAVADPSDERPDVVKPSPSGGIFSFLPFSNPIVSYSMAAAILLIAVGVSWVVINNWRKQTQPQPGNVYVVSLAPGLTRGSGEITKVTIPPKSDDVRLQLPLPDNQYQSYKAVLQDSNGDILLTKSNLKPQSVNGRPVLLMDVVPNLIPPGDYRITVGGLTANGNSESVSNFPFRVLSK